MSIEQRFPESSFDTMTEDISITIKVPVDRKKSTKEWKELWTEIKKTLFQTLPKEKFPTNQLMYQLYQEDIFQVWLREQKITRKPSSYGPN